MYTQRRMYSNLFFFFFLAALSVAQRAQVLFIHCQLIHCLLPVGPFVLLPNTYICTNRKWKTDPEGKVITLSSHWRILLFLATIWYCCLILTWNIQSKIPCLVWRPLNLWGLMEKAKFLRSTGLSATFNSLTFSSSNPHISGSHSLWHRCLSHLALLPEQSLLGREVNCRVFSRIPGFYPSLSHHKSLQTLPHVRTTALAWWFYGKGLLYNL